MEKIDINSLISDGLKLVIQNIADSYLLSNTDIDRNLVYFHVDTVNGREKRFFQVTLFKYGVVSDNLVKQWLLWCIQNFEKTSLKEWKDKYDFEDLGSFLLTDIPLTGMSDIDQQLLNVLCKAIYDSVWQVSEIDKDSIYQTFKDIKRKYFTDVAKKKVAYAQVFNVWVSCLSNNLKVYSSQSSLLSDNRQVYNSMVVCQLARSALGIYKKSQLRVKKSDQQQLTLLMRPKSSEDILYEERLQELKKNFSEMDIRKGRMYPRVAIDSSGEIYVEFSKYGKPYGKSFKQWVLQNPEVVNIHPKEWINYMTDADWQNKIEGSTGSKIMTGIYVTKDINTNLKLLDFVRVKALEFLWQVSDAYDADAIALKFKQLAKISLHKARKVFAARDKEVDVNLELQTIYKNLVNKYNIKYGLAAARIYSKLYIIDFQICIELYKYGDIYNTAENVKSFVQWVKQNPDFDPHYWWTKYTHAEKSVNKVIGAFKTGVQLVGNDLIDRELKGFVRSLVHEAVWLNYRDINAIISNFNKLKKQKLPQLIENLKLRQFEYYKYAAEQEEQWFTLFPENLGGIKVYTSEQALLDDNIEIYRDLILFEMIQQAYVLNFVKEKEEEEEYEIAPIPVAASYNLIF